MTQETYVSWAAHDTIEGVATITINRPNALNALNPDVLTQLTSIAHELESQDNLRAIVLTGAGRAFVAGADIKSMLEMGSEEASKFAILGHNTMNAIASLAVPTIAAINGFALGAGLELALTCDLIYMSQKGRVGLPEVGLGLIPGFGGTQRLARRVGYQYARELVFTGRTIKPDEAQRIGLTLAVVEHDTLMDHVYGVASEIASKGPRAIRVAKQVMESGRYVPLHKALEYEKDSFSDLFDSGEPKEGMSAFVEKRTPDFTNNT